MMFETSGEHVSQTDERVNRHEETAIEGAADTQVAITTSPPRSPHAQAVLNYAYHFTHTHIPQIFRLALLGQPAGKLVLEASLSLSLSSPIDVISKRPGVGGAPNITHTLNEKADEKLRAHRNSNVTTVFSRSLKID